MIAIMLWPLIQVNLPLMFYVNEIPISPQKYKVYSTKVYNFSNIHVIFVVKEGPANLTLTLIRLGRYDLKCCLVMLTFMYIYVRVFPP